MGIAWLNPSYKGFGRYSVGSRITSREKRRTGFDKLVVESKRPGDGEAQARQAVTAS
jgi:hypothetical protein